VALWADNATRGPAARALAPAAAAAPRMAGVSHRAREPADGAAGPPVPASSTGLPERHSREVGEAEAGERLDRHLARWLGLSRARVRRLLERGGVRLAGRPVGLPAKGVALAPGERLEVDPEALAAEEHPAPRPDLPLAVLAEGDGWIAVDKPAGRPVHPLRPDETDTVLNAVLGRYPSLRGVGEGGLRSGVVHRLDVGTSGALAVATRQEAWERLREAFRGQRVDKRYRALVRGRVEAPFACRVGLVVAQHRPARVRVVEAEAAARDPAVRLGLLEGHPLESLGEATEVEIRLRTGFLHQIRATLAARGHPVLDDPLYAGDAAPGGASGREAAGRPMLHAAQLALEGVTADSPLPSDYRARREALRRAAREAGGPCC